MKGSNNKTCIIALTVQALREDHRHQPVHAVRGSSDIGRPGQRVHSPKEWGRSLLIPTPERAMKAGFAARGRPRQQSRERLRTGQFPLLQCCLVHGIGRLHCTPPSSHEGSQHPSQGQAGAAKRLQGEKPSKRVLGEGGCTLGSPQVGDSQLSSRLSVDLSILSITQENQEHVNTLNGGRRISTGKSRGE